MLTMVRAVVSEAITERCPTEQEQEWVRLAMKAQAQRVQLRNAIIEKTLTGLIWAMLLGVGYAVWEYIRLKIGSPRP